MGTMGILTAMIYMKIKGKAPDATVIYVKKPASFSEPTPKWDKTTYAKHEMNELMAAVTQAWTRSVHVASG